MDQLLDAADIFDRLGGKLGPAARAGGGLAPALDRLVDRFDPGLVLRVRGQIVIGLAVEPIYEEMDGWSGTTAGARSWADLPAQAIKYIQRVQELIETPVALVSTSPEREDTILVRDPFVD